MELLHYADELVQAAEPFHDITKPLTTYSVKGVG